MEKIEKIEKIKPSGIFCNYIFKAIPLAFDESLSYYETLCGLLKKVKTIEEVVNNHADVIIELENYVTHYFDNLDVQEEINNKLDDMAESGELAEIISLYLAYSNILGFDTIADMKASTVLVNGSICKCLGKTNYLMGDGSFYRVRTLQESDVIDEENIVSLDDDTLVAIKINDNKLDKRYLLESSIQATLYKELNLFPNGYSTSAVIITKVNNVNKGIAVANDWTEGGSEGTKFNIVTFDFNNETVSNKVTRVELADGHANSMCEIGNNKVLICGIGYNYIYDLSNNTNTLVTDELPYFSMVANDSNNNIYGSQDYDYDSNMVVNKLYVLDVDNVNNTISIKEEKTVPNLREKIQGNEQGMVIYDNLLIYISFSNCKLCIYDLSTLEYLKTQLFTAPYIVEYEDGFVFNNELYLCDTLGRLFKPNIYNDTCLGGYDRTNITKSLTNICLLDDPIKINHGGSKTIDFLKYMTFMNYESGDTGVIGKQLESITIYGAIRNYSASGGVHNLTPIELPMYKNITVTGETISWYAKGWSASWEEYSSNDTTYSKFMISGTFDFGGGDTNPTLTLTVSDRLAVISIASDGTVTGDLSSENDFEFYITKIIGHRKVGINL